MNDILETLRAEANYAESKDNLVALGQLLHRAADEIERLRKHERTPGGFTIGPNIGDKWRCTHCGAPAEDQPSIPPQLHSE